MENDGLLRSNSRYGAGALAGEDGPGNPVAINRDRLEKERIITERAAQVNQACSRMPAREMLYMEARELRRRAEQLELVAAILPSNLHQLSAAADEALYELVQRARR